MADTRQIFNYEIHQNDLYVRDPGVMAPLKAVDLIDTKRPKFPRGTLLFRHALHSTGQINFLQSFNSATNLSNANSFLLLHFSSS